MNSLKELKDRFKEEFKGITDIDELKELYALELAKRDKLIFDLQKQNEIVVKSALRSKDIDLSSN
jgi:hypothetical protein